MIEAKIIKDSLGPSGSRITTFVLKYPRFIHSEFMTHRMFSRNASSSRAIPIEKQIELIEKETARPLVFRKNQKGMQAAEPLSAEEQQQADAIWDAARDDAIKHARSLIQLGVHKQYVNRLLEPFSTISVIVTSTEWANFFALRYHSAAQPEIEQLAKIMYHEYEKSIPKVLKENEWHLPFIDEEVTPENIETLIKRSVAKCARVSYLNHDGTETTESQDLILYNKLLGAQPIHASPAEHQAQATCDPLLWSGNFRGWVQYRKTLYGECVKNFNGPLG
jgi:thymidylate synthase ThyX